MIARVLVDDVMRPIDGPDAKKTARRRIDQFGFSNSLRLIVKYCDLSAEHNELNLKYVGDSVVGERPTYVIERRSACCWSSGCVRSAGSCPPGRAPRARPPRRRPA